MAVEVDDAFIQSFPDRFDVDVAYHADHPPLDILRVLLAPLGCR